jgi:tetratricopeptide (TPR) repeat protein
MKMRPRLAVVAVLAAGFVWLVPPAARAQSAEKLYARGQRAFDRGKYDDAIAAWQRSYELSNEPALLFNLGQAHRLAGHCPEALAHYEKFLQLDAASAQRATAEQFVAQLTAQCRPAPPAPPPVDAHADAPAPLAPVAPPPGSPADERPGRTKQIIGLATAAGGAVLVLTGLYFGSEASSLSDDVTDACQSSCNWADVMEDDAAGRQAERRARVFVGLGLVTAATGGVLYYLGRREADAASPAAATVSIGATDGGAIVVWGGTW